MEMRIVVIFTLTLTLTLLSFGFHFDSICTQYWSQTMRTQSWLRTKIRAHPHLQRLQWQSNERTIALSMAQAMAQTEASMALNGLHSVFAGIRCYFLAFAGIDSNSMASRHRVVGAVLRLTHRRPSHHQWNSILFRDGLMPFNWV